MLNLISPSDSTIKYTHVQFPDGQQQIVLNLNEQRPEYCNIISRLNNFLDLEKIICAVQSLKASRIYKIHLYITYFSGARSDRKFESESNHYLRDVICPIINNLNLTSITVLDPHSDVLEGCLHSFFKTSPNNFIEWCLSQLGASEPMYLSPDNGASKKIENVVSLLNRSGEIVICSKQRDVTGKITKTIVPYFDLSKNVVIIDDICDGGATFVKIAEIIKQRYEEMEHKHQDHGKLYLCVTHGIFSKGFKKLAKYFDGVFCTNSYKSFEDYDFGDMQELFIKNWFKQYDVLK